MSVSTNLLHNDHNIIKAQPGDDRCPVNSFKHYINLLNPKLDAFFQCPSRDKKKFDNMVLGKGPLADMMKVISEKAKLSDIYTNYCIRKTTGTAMHKSRASPTETSHLMKQKNLQSLENYVAGPTMEDKERLANMLYNYTKPKENNYQNAKTDGNENMEENNKENTATIDLQVIPNVDTEKAVIPHELNFNKVTKNINQPTTSNILTNT